MGLDISGVVFKKFKGLPNVYDTVSNQGFFRSLLKSEMVKYDYSDDCMEYVGGGPSMSYGSYNRFRNELSMAALNKKAEEAWEEVRNLEDGEPYPSAIYHIINFSDCEGYIGPSSVKELNQYLLNNHDRIRKYFVDRDDNWNLSNFDILVKCVRDTSKVNGYLEFS